jgi:hypothetical protein
MSNGIQYPKRGCRVQDRSGLEAAVSSMEMARGGSCSCTSGVLNLGFSVSRVVSGVPRNVGENLSIFYVFAIMFTDLL